MKRTGANTSLSFADDEFAMGVEYEDSNSDSDLGIHVCCWRLSGVCFRVPRWSR
jgi:hypothetical protein